MDSADKMIVRLTKLGFFKFTRPSELNRAIALLRKNYIKHQILDTNHLVADMWVPYDRRIYMADAEDLAEGSVCSMIEEMRIVLKREGVHLHSLRNDLDEDGDSYRVFINGESYEIYDENRAEYSSWCWAHRRTLEILNDLLAAAGSKERAYALSAGNQAMVALLTQKLYQYLLTLPFDEYSIPRKPEEMECE